MLLDQFPFEDVANWLAEGRIVPLLGAGASRVGAAGPNELPDGRSLATELIARMPAYPGQAADGLAKAAEYYEQAVFDRPALFEYLRKRFYEEQRNAPLTRVAQLLADMPNPQERSRFIITTNYDIFIERAFDKARRPLCVITQNVKNPEHGASQLTLKLPDGTYEHEDAVLLDLDDDSRFPAGTTYLFKMHGSADQKGNESDGMVITESDYVEFMVNANGPVSTQFPPAALLAAYSRRRFLFLGYSLEDWNFRIFFRLLSLRNAISKSGNFRHWAIQRHPNPLDVALWGKRNVNVFDADLLEFCDKLEAIWAPQDAA